MKLLILFIRLSGWPIALPIASGLASSVLSVMLINQIGRLAGGAHFQRANWLSLGAVVVLASTLRIVSTTTLTRNTQNIVRLITQHVLDQALRIPLVDFESINSAEMFAILTRDVDALTDVAISIPPICISAAMIIAAAGYGIASAPMLTFAWCAVVSIGVWLFKRFERTSVAKFREARAEHANLVQIFQEVVSASKELRVNITRRYRLEDQAASITAIYRNAMITAIDHFSFSNSIAEFIYLLLLIAAAGVLRLTPPHTWAGVSSFLLLMLYTKTSIESIVGFQPQMSRGRIALDNFTARGFHFDRNLKTAKTKQRFTPPIHAAAPIITYSGVTFSYNGSANNSFRLQPAFFEIRGGQSTFITGQNGSGKTTLLKVLAGLYQPAEGQILLNGRPIDEASSDLYRSYLSVIFSDFHLISDLPPQAKQIPQAKIDEFLTILGLKGVVTVTEGGLSTIALSQGQRKRLAILNVLLEDRPVLLFDEVASDQDPEFRQFFYQELLPQLKAAGKAVVLITHDQQYFTFADQAVQLASGGPIGSVSPDGTPRSSSP